MGLTLEQFKQWISETFPDNTSREINEEDLRNGLDKMAEFVTETNSDTYITSKLSEITDLVGKSATYSDAAKVFMATAGQYALQSEGAATLARIFQDTWDMVENVPDLEALTLTEADAGKFWKVNETGEDGTDTEITGETVTANNGDEFTWNGTKWVWSRNADEGFKLATKVKNVIFSEEAVGATTLVNTANSSIVNRVLLTQQRFFSSSGPAKSVDIMIVGSVPGNIRLIQLRKNLELGKYTTVVAHLVPVEPGLNNVNLAESGFQIEPGDTFCIQIVEVGVAVGTVTVGTGIVAYTAVSSVVDIEFTVAQVEGSTGAGQVCFKVHMESDFTQTAGKRLELLESFKGTAGTTLTGLSTALAGIDQTVDAISEGVLAIEQTVISEVLPTDGSFFKDTFSGWGVGYLPTVIEHIDKLVLSLNDVNYNEKLQLKIYSRPVADIAVTANPGMGGNDVTILTKDFAVALFQNTAAWQDCIFDFAEMAMNPTHIYLFTVKGIRPAAAIGKIGIKRKVVTPNVLPQYARGWYNNLSASNAALVASSTYCVTYKLIGNRQVNKVGQMAASLTGLTLDVAAIKANYLAAQHRRDLLLWADPLTAISGQWINANGWTASANGITPATTGMASYIQLNRQYGLYKRKFRIRVTAGSDSRPLIFTRPIEPNVNEGTVFEMDFGAHEIRIYKKYFDNGLLPAVQTFKSFPFVAGREFIVEVSRDNQANVIKVIDTVSGFSDELIDNSNLSGRQYDSYCLACYSGSLPVFRDLVISTKVKKYVRRQFTGDSITHYRYGATTADGYAYMYIAATNYENDIDQSGCVSARGGGNIDGILRRFDTETIFLLPLSLSATIGTNGGNTPEKLTTLINKARAVGIVPYINNVPREGNGDDLVSNPVIQQVRQDLGVKGCLFDVATSINNVVANGLDQTLYNSDSGAWVHPNAAGQVKMFQRFEIDTPEL